jgi:hypothetical protein
MKCNLEDLRKALDQFRYMDSSDNMEVEITMSEESIEKGKLGSMLIITATSEKPPSSYESLQTKKTIKKTIEVFASHENQKSRMITEEIQELDFGKKA